MIPSWVKPTGWRPVKTRPQRPGENRRKFFCRALAVIAFNLPIQVLPADLPVGAVVTQHALATAAGVEIFRRGGNAIDAAVAAAFALAVVEPYNSGLGGGGFLLAKNESGFWFLDFRERASHGANAEIYHRDGRYRPEMRREGWLAAGIPGMVKGMAWAQKKAGTLPFSEVLQPAIRLADEGFALDGELAARLHRHRELLIRDAEARKIFFRRGLPLRQGERLKQRHLAETLRRIAASQGEDFYRGKIAHRIAMAYARYGKHFITLEDLRDYRVFEAEPIRWSFRGYTLLGAPPPSSGGGLTAEVLLLVEGLIGKESEEVDHLHVFAEALRIAFADRGAFYGDPRFVQVPISHLLSPTYLRQKQVQIRKGRRSEPVSIDPLAGGTQTTHLVTADAQGRVVSLTQSLNTSFGSGVIMPGTGVLLNNTLDDFSAPPSDPNAFGLSGGPANALQPDRTPLSSMSPTLVMDAKGRVILALGSPGGPRIISSVAQALWHTLVRGMELREAVDAPRIHHQFSPDLLFVEENGFSPAVMETLRKRGHVLRFEKPWGNVQALAIEHSPDTGSVLQFHGVSDSRGHGVSRLARKP